MDRVHVLISEVTGRRSAKLKRTPAGQSEKDEDVTASLLELNKVGAGG